MKKYLLLILCFNCLLSFAQNKSTKPYKKAKTIQTGNRHPNSISTHSQSFSSPIQLGRWDVYALNDDDSYSKIRMNFNFYNNGIVEMEQTEQINNQYRKGNFSIRGSTIYIYWEGGSKQEISIVNQTTISIASALKAIYSGY